MELRTLSPDERKQTIAAFVEDDILYKEACKRGLDKGDTRMRRNLIVKMRGLLGFDHLLFVLALLMIVRGAWMLVKTITAFTIAHSITLGLATLGFVHVPPRP